MNEDVQRIIDRARARGQDPRVAGVSGTYAFEVRGVGTWRMSVDAGRIEVLDGPGHADCVVRADPDDFVRIAEGEQNLITAYMQGLVEIEGDMVLAQKLHGLLPSPPHAQAGARP